jgi:acetyltransferase-like isoleucine patch superfamily enzyme
MMYLHKMLRYVLIDGIYLPFKIHNNAYIKIRKGAELKLGSRVTIGNAAGQAIVSCLPTNLYFGKNSKTQIKRSVSIGPGVNIIVKDNARLSIGENTYFTSDMHIELVNKLSIGSNCAISWGVTIIDDDHHQLIHETENKPVKNDGVKIGDHVWVGCNVTILKNTHIGNHCVVAAGSVVKGVFPDHVLIGGNPARIIKNNIDWK